MTEKSTTTASDHLGNPRYQARTKRLREAEDAARQHVINDLTYRLRETADVVGESHRWSAEVVTAVNGIVDWLGYPRGHHRSLSGFVTGYLEYEAEAAALKAEEAEERARKTAESQADSGQTTKEDM